LLDLETPTIQKKQKNQINMNKTQKNYNFKFITAGQRPSCTRQKPIGPL